MHVQKNLVEGKNLQSKRKKTGVAENRHLKNSPKIKIRQRIFPTGCCPKIPELP